MLRRVQTLKRRAKSPLRHTHTALCRARRLAQAVARSCVAIYVVVGVAAAAAAVPEGSRLFVFSLSVGAQFQGFGHTKLVGKEPILGGVFSIDILLAVAAVPRRVARVRQLCPAAAAVAAEAAVRVHVYYVRTGTRVRGQEATHLVELAEIKRRPTGSTTRRN